MPRAKSGLGQASRFALFILNFFALIGSITCLAVGLWVLVEKSRVEFVVGTDLFTSSAYILSAVGILSIFITILGCLGSLKELKCLLIAYFSSLLIIFLLSLIAGIIGLLFKTQLHQILYESMVSSMKFNYGLSNGGKDHRSTDAWDHVQRKLHCCAINNYTDYTAWSNTQWFETLTLYPRERVPKSCCVDCAQLYGSGLITKDLCLRFLGETRKPTGEKNQLLHRLCTQCPQDDADFYPDLDQCQGSSADSLLQWPQANLMYTKGCYDPLLAEMELVSQLLGGVGLGMAALILIIMVFAVCLYRDI